MRSNYKKIGDFIKKVNDRNTELKVINLMGINIDKFFMPSVANTVGTDMSKYRVVKKGQFACNRMHVGRDRRLPVALWTGDKEIIVSPAYDVFEIEDKEVLEPEYLMMWFLREEFDRNAWFYTDADVRGGLTWEDFSNIQFLVPPIEKQKEIIKKYKTLTDRINVNSLLIQKLEETAHSIYKQWFIDFEFPDENGKSYKSNGGNMEYNIILDMEIPRGWEPKKIEQLCECNSSTLSSKDIFETIAYLDTSNITNNEIDEIMIFNLKEDKVPSRAKRKVIHNDIIFSTVRPNLKHFGILKDPTENMIVSTGFAVLRPNYPNLCSELVYLTITNEEVLQDLQAKAEMSVSTYPSIKPEDLLNIDFIMPPESILIKAESIFDAIFNLIHFIQKEKELARTSVDILLSRLAIYKEVVR